MKGDMMDVISGRELERLLADQSSVDDAVAIALASDKVTEKTKHLLRTEPLRQVLLDNTTRFAEMYRRSGGWR
ncbi:hypothetical protein [Lactiplantibacillus songbeiensis]|uniref:Uncharacterized protein n=1 Tax=Lactiplantibacillus songbeiensis TaxID=2559920 RepID=A0ABW4C090_9LACO|nr:hypothetical protein [Lactiplantibacillus songbeiensis]